MDKLVFRLTILGVILLASGISASFRKRARDEGGTIKRQEEGWGIFIIRMGVALPLLVVILLNIFWPSPLAWAKFIPSA